MKRVKCFCGQPHNLHEDEGGFFVYCPKLEDPFARDHLGQTGKIYVNFEPAGSRRLLVEFSIKKLPSEKFSQLELGI